MHNNKHIFKIIFYCLSILTLLVIRLTTGESTKEWINKTKDQTAVLGQTDQQTVKVKRVIDGDTIVLEDGHKVRYIGIDTPEIKDCYFQEAKTKNQELVEGKEIALEKDVSETDRYKRLLRYIWVGEILVNKTLVREGYAQASTYPPDVRYQPDLISAQKQAQAEGLGIWSQACQ